MLVSGTAFWNGVSTIKSYHYCKLHGFKRLELQNAVSILAFPSSGDEGQLSRSFSNACRILWTVPLSTELVTSGLWMLSWSSLRIGISLDLWTVLSCRRKREPRVRMLLRHSPLPPDRWGSSLNPAKAR